MLQPFTKRGGSRRRGRGLFRRLRVAGTPAAPSTSAELRARALRLPPAERITLAERLFDSVYTEDPGLIEKAWIGELRRRLENLSRTRDDSISAREILDRMLANVGRMARRSLPGDARTAEPGS